MLQYHISMLLEVVLFEHVFYLVHQYIRITQVLRVLRNIVIMLKDNDCSTRSTRGSSIYRFCTDYLSSLNIFLLVEVVLLEHMFYLVPQYIQITQVLRAPRNIVIMPKDNDVQLAAIRLISICT